MGRRKVLFHACKASASAVNGVLLGTASGEKVDIVEAVPLFHDQLNLLPLFEMAMLQIESYCAESNVSIVGYYQANEHADDVELSETGQRIANQIASFTPKACALVLNSRALESKNYGDSTLFKVFAKSAKVDAAWKEAPQSTSLAKDTITKEMSSSFAANVQKGRALHLVDFHDHVNDPSLPWLSQSHVYWTA